MLLQFYAELLQIESLFHDIFSKETHSKKIVVCHEPSLAPLGVCVILQFIMYYTFFVSSKKSGFIRTEYRSTTLTSTFPPYIIYI